MSIEYDHSRNLHSLLGPKFALPCIFQNQPPQSILDVGCGAGAWLRAALELGVADVFGIDGVDIPPKQLLFSPARFKKCDLTAPIALNRRFDAVLCLEVAEHLESQFASVLLKTLTRHSDKIFFSAACPGQTGQHHVNCQWPEYWQRLFNEEGFVCEDSLRWQIWANKNIEPWYRQNLILARRDLKRAGTEPRVPPVVHPELIPSFEAAAQAKIAPSLRSKQIIQVEHGCMPTMWYFSTIGSALGAKMQRAIATGKPIRNRE
jgi:SAM-dependent methyltransferase